MENVIRPIAIGKKNWLLATAKLNGLEPLRWLTNTLDALPTCPNSQIDSLLPFAKSSESQS
ncbi:hypothetical protein AAKU55_005615 [Oxalobacteraceae bacterium GrIS 1.11]